MDQFSFLNAAHTAYFAELYDQYLQFPDSVEPSWRAFFQGFDFGKGLSVVEETETSSENKTIAEPGNGTVVNVPDNVLKEFQHIDLI